MREIEVAPPRREVRGTYAGCVVDVLEYEPLEDGAYDISIVHHGMEVLVGICRVSDGAVRLIPRNRRLEGFVTELLRTVEGE